MQVISIKKEGGEFSMAIMVVVWHSACLGAGQLHIGTPYGACPALWGCGHTRSIWAIRLYTTIGAVRQIDILLLVLMRWMLGIIKRSGAEVKALSWMTFNCPVCECHIPDGDVNCGPLLGARR